MEVYVVTSGVYSDYGIEKVFLDKEKAEHYAQWGYGRRVEVYNSSDDYKVNEVYKIVVNGNIAQNHIVLDPTISIYETDRHFDDSIYFHTSWHSTINDVYAFGFTKYISNDNYDKEFLYNKYKKAYYDLANIIKYHLSEGATEDDIDKMLKFYLEKVRTNRYEF